MLSKAGVYVENSDDYLWTIIVKNKDGSIQRLMQKFNENDKLYHVVRCMANELKLPIYIDGKLIK